MSGGRSTKGSDKAPNTYYVGGLCQYVYCIIKAAVDVHMLTVVSRLS